jgi:hypothetical protein
VRKAPTKIPSGYPAHRRQDDDGALRHAHVICG